MKSVPSYPPKAVKYYEEGIRLHQNQKLASAERAYRKAIKISQNFVEAHTNLGNVLVDRSRFKEASHAYTRALGILPDHPMLLNNLGNVFQLQGEIEKAISWCNKAIMQDPTYADAHNNLANAFRELGRFDEAVTSYRQALELDPDLTEAHTNLGILLTEQDKLDSAVTSLEKAIEIDPEHTDAYNALGNVLCSLGRTEKAVSAYRKTIQIDPKHTEAYLGLGNALQALGQWDEAIKSYLQVIELEPDHAGAYYYLSQVRNFCQDDEIVSAMEKLYQNPKISADRQMQLSFALGKAQADVADYDQAFSYIDHGNQLNWSSIQYDVGTETRYFEQLKSAFTLDTFSQVEIIESNEITPVFILGLPRSGKTLAEAMLAEHPLVYPAGERNFLENTIAQVSDIKNPQEVVDRILGLPRDKVARLAEQYTDQVGSLSDGEPFVVDTMPINFYYIGFIKLIFPNAKVIHCHRLPEDACWFIYQKYFRGGRHHYSFDLAALGAYYKGYSDLMSHWNSVLPGFIHDLQYEQLVTQTSHELKQLSAFTNLDWDGTCLDRYEDKPLHDNDIGSWRNYQDHLAPLLRALH
jgi:tetratricopeptide (TPR) repeat protein